MNFKGKLYVDSDQNQDFDFLWLENSGRLESTWPGTYAGSQSFTDVMKGWTNQAGYPLITAGIDCSSVVGQCIIKLEQSMYATNGVADESRIWTVPVFSYIMHGYELVENILCIQRYQAKCESGL